MWIYLVCVSSIDACYCEADWMKAIQNVLLHVETKFAFGGVLHHDPLFSVVLVKQGSPWSATNSP